MIFFQFSETKELHKIVCRSICKKAKCAVAAAVSAAIRLSYVNGKT